MHVIVATGFRVSICVRVLYVLASIKRQESPAAGQLRPNLGGRAIHARMTPKTLQHAKSTTTKLGKKILGLLTPNEKLSGTRFDVENVSSHKYSPNLPITPSS